MLRTQIIFDEMNSVLMLPNFARVIEVASIIVPLSHPLNFSSLTPKDIILPQKCIMTIVKGPQPSIMPQIMRDRINPFNPSNFFLNIHNLYINVIETGFFST